MVVVKYKSLVSRFCYTGKVIYCACAMGPAGLSWFHTLI
jgi:hypothetical protein